MCVTLPLILLIPFVSPFHAAIRVLCRQRNDNHPVLNGTELGSRVGEVRSTSVRKPIMIFDRNGSLKTVITRAEVVTVKMSLREAKIRILLEDVYYYQQGIRGYRKHYVLEADMLCGFR